MKHRTSRAAGWALAVTCLLAGGLGACSASRSLESVRPADVPAELQEEYALFAQRCSKCHGLARPLNAGDKSDVFWQHYVTRMRQQPGSGIAPEDEPPILRFLHWYSAKIRTEANGGTK